MKAFCVRHNFLDDTSLTGSGWVRKQTYLRTVAAAVVLTFHAPPAMTLLQDLHSQMPTALRFTESYRMRKEGETKRSGVSQRVVLFSLSIEGRQVVEVEKKEENGVEPTG
jgi:hypothetical protein